MTLCLGLTAQPGKTKKGRQSAKKQKIEAAAEDNLYLNRAASKNKDYIIPEEKAEKEVLDDEKTGPPALGIYDYINKANTVANDSPQQALDFVESALSLSFKSNDKRGEAFCYNTLGGINYQLNRYDVSVDNYLKAIQLFRNVEDEQGLYNSYKYLSSSYDAQENNEKALETYAIFLEKARSKSEYGDMISTLKNMGRIYFNSGRYDAAKKNFLEVLSLETQLNRSDGILVTYNYLGKVYDALEVEDSALYYFDLAGVKAIQSGNQKAISQSLDYKSDFYRSRNRRDEELQVRNEALFNSSQNQNLEEIQKSNLDIGKIYVETDKPEEAIPYLKKSIDLADEIGELNDKSEAYEALAEAYEKIGDLESALSTIKTSKEIDNTIQQQKFEEIEDNLAVNDQLNVRDQRIANLIKDQELIRERLRVAEKEKEVQIANYKRQRLISYSLIGGILLIAISGFFVLRSNQAKRKANLLLHLKSLRSQMNPHFIFNSLNSVNSFIAKNDDRSANKYLADFSKLMRAVMENSQEDFVPMATEVRILELYLGLEHFRFKDKFDYEFKVDPGIEQESVEIPPMLIQPYIENAIWHGLRYRNEMGFLSVSILEEGDYLNVVVEDNGIGREKSMALKTKNQKAQKSTGLKNTSERLRIINTLYKKNLTVNIEDVMDGEECTGTRVEIRIPVSH